MMLLTFFKQNFLIYRRLSNNFAFYVANSLSTFFSPSTADEVSTIIRELKDKKANISKNIITHFLKVGNIMLAPYSSTLFNHCLTKAIYRDGL